MFPRTSARINLTNNILFNANEKHQQQQKTNGINKAKIKLNINTLIYKLGINSNNKTKWVV